MNIPNLLVLLRLVLAALTIYLLLVPGWEAKIGAAVAFAAASFSDWLDGYLARRWNQITPFGILMDPIADKILVLGVFSVFTYLGIMPLWMLVIIVLREVLITVVRLLLAKDVVLAAAVEGKWKTTSQMIAIGLVLLYLILQNTEGGRLAGLQTVMTIALWVAVLLTLYSGLMFFWRNKAVIQQGLRSR